MEASGVDMEIMWYSFLAASFGGVVCFLLALKYDRYHNNRLFAKFLIDVVGGCLTGAILSLAIPSPLYRFVAAFFLGVSWARVLQKQRDKLTEIINRQLGQT